MQREDAVSFLVKLGATVQDKINLQTHYLIMGTISEMDAETESTSLPAEVECSKHNENEAKVEQVAQRIQEGQPIRILSQRQLLACIPSALAIARGDG